MTFRYHGNWCGPGWSDARYVASVHGFAPSLDEFDETCRQHDFALSGGRSDFGADDLFFSQNAGKGPKRTFAAVAVKTRSLVDRMFAMNKTTQESLPTMTKPSLRGASTKKQAGPSGPTVQKRMISAPAAIGSVMRAVKTQHIQTKNGAILRGTDFIAPVEGQGVATFGLGKSAMLSPAYFLSTFLGNMARSFSKYRWNKLRIHYVPRVATTATGQVVLCSSKSVSEPCLAGESGTFLQRAMSQGNASLGPLWMENYIDIDTTRSFHLVDPATTSDLDDVIAEELQVYVQTGASGQVGYLYAEYEIEFTELVYQPHATTIPIPTGPGVRVQFVDDAAIHGLGDDFSLIETGSTLGLATVPNGTIYRAVFDLPGSTVYTGGVSFGSGYTVVTAFRTSIGAGATIANTCPVPGGSTFYLVVAGSRVLVYTSLEAAVGGFGTGQMFYAFAGTVAGTYQFDLALVRIGATQLPTVQ